jgi:ECF transporter S component (folate family)
MQAILIGGIFMKKNSIISPFRAEYWIIAASEIKNLRTLTFAAITIALSIIINSFSITVSQNLHIALTFIPFCFGALIFGPVVGLSVGFVCDIVGFMMFPSGIFFPGYTLSTMLKFFIYGLFLYRSRITIFKIFIAKLLVDFGINVLLGSLWSAILFKKGYLYFFAKSLIKNSMMLPIEVFILVIFFQISIPLLVQVGIIEKQSLKHIPFI